MPIQIKIEWLSELFQYITNVSNFDSTIAKQQFNNALDNYCDSLGCLEAKPDKGIPDKA